MKKLMIAASVVALAAATQAASITWASMGFTELPSCVNPGGVGYADEGPSCVAAYLWTFTAEEWAVKSYESPASVYDAWKAGTLNAGNATAGEWGEEGYVAFSTATTTSGTAMADNVQYYAAALFLHNDGTSGDPDYYMGNWATALASNMDGRADSLGTKVGGLSSLHTPTANTEWTTTAVPEPTSGLLLLLGVAGLALRRRRV